MSDATHDPKVTSAKVRSPVRSFRVIALMAILGFAGWWLIGAPGYEPGFAEEDIDATKASIKEQFEKRPGVTVTDVFLMKKSASELTGFAKLKIAGLNYELTKACTVTRGEDTHYMWSCQ